MLKKILPICFILCLEIVSTQATELSIPALESSPGSMVQVPIIIDHIDNLAGIKLVIEYDNQSLKFKNGKKTKITNSLMHIINDKKPGKVIVVMAAARGVVVNNTSIIDLNFVVNNNLSVETKPFLNLKVRELQLMSDTLKEIDCKIKLQPIKIVASKPEIKKSSKAQVSAAETVKLQTKPATVKPMANPTKVKTIDKLNTPLKPAIEKPEQVKMETVPVPKLNPIMLKAKPDTLTFTNIVKDIQKEINSDDEK